MRRTFVLGFIALVALVGAGCLVGARVLAASPAKGGDSTIQIRSRYLAVHLKSSTEYGATLEKVSIRRIGDRSFLVGKAINDGSAEWYSGKTIWVATDNISMMIEFNDLSTGRAGRSRGTP